MAVRDIDEALPMYTDMLGAKLLVKKMIGYAGNFYFTTMMLGDTMLELVQPVDNTSPIMKFLDKKGEGMHHLSMEVENLPELIEKMESNGYRIVDKFDTPAWKSAFISPRSSRGALIQIWEAKRKKKK